MHFNFGIPEWKWPWCQPIRAWQKTWSSAGMIKNFLSHVRCKILHRIVLILLTTKLGCTGQGCYWYQQPIVGCHTTLFCSTLCYRSALQQGFHHGMFGCLTVHCTLNSWPDIFFFSLVPMPYWYWSPPNVECC